MAEVVVSAPTIGAAVTAAARTLRASTTPRLDAELLLAEVLGGGRERLIIDRDELLGAAAAQRFSELVARRAAHEPIAYILGRRDFRRLTLSVDRRVLIPRPETELLVEAALELPAGASVLDVGTGSGAVALALAAERPDLRVRGIDVSAEAIDLARVNAATLRLDVSFMVGDLALALGKPVDALLANLPYVPDSEPLMADVARYEPPLALRGGPDGLDLIRRLCVAVAAFSPVARPRLLALELGPEQAHEVAALVKRCGYREVGVLRDLAGRERVVAGRR